MHTYMSRFCLVFAALTLIALSPSACARIQETEMTDMQFIDGGTFRMGDVLDEDIQLATPVHEVTVSGFYLNKHEVTVEEFSDFVAHSEYVTSAEMGARCETPQGAGSSNSEDDYGARLSCRGAWVLDTPKEGSWVAEANWKNPQFEQGPRDPVVGVSWRDAVSYCNWLSEKEGLPASYDVETGHLVDAEGQPTTDTWKARGYRLPTEAEWEYAAREGGENVRFGNGQNIAKSSDMNINAAEAEFPFAASGEFRRRTMPVGSFKPNSLGLHDMSGNVWEWCSDYVDRYEATPQDNPYQTRGDIDLRRAARGGPWVGDASLARVSVRLGWVAEDRCNNIGFRIARSE